MVESFALLRSAAIRLGWKLRHLFLLPPVPPDLPLPTLVNPLAMMRLLVTEMATSAIALVVPSRGLHFVA